MTLGEFMIGLFLICLVLMIGVALAHYIVRAVSFVAWCCIDFIEAWQSENGRRPYDYEKEFDNRRGL